MQKLKDFFKPKPKNQSNLIIIQSEVNEMSKHNKKKDQKHEDLAPALPAPPLPATPEPVKHVPAAKAKTEEVAAVAEVANKPVVVAAEQLPVVQLPAADIKPYQPLTQAEYDVLMSAIEKYILDGSLPDGSLDRLKQRAVKLSDAEKKKMSAGIATDLIDSNKIESIENPAKYGLCLLGAVSGAIVLTTVLSRYLEDALEAGAVATAATLVGANAYSSSQTAPVIDARRNRYRFFHGVLNVPTPQDITAANTAVPQNKM